MARPDWHELTARLGPQIAREPGEGDEPDEDAPVYEWRAVAHYSGTRHFTVLARDEDEARERADEEASDFALVDFECEHVYLEGRADE